MTELILVDCATCGEEIEIFEDDSEFNCPYCKSQNVLIDASDEAEAEEEIPEQIVSDKTPLTLNRSIITSWCSRHKEAIDHSWMHDSRVGPRLFCLECWPSQVPKAPIRHVKEERWVEAEK